MDGLSLSLMTPLIPFVSTDNKPSFKHYEQEANWILRRSSNKYSQMFVIQHMETLILLKMFGCHITPCWYVKNGYWIRD
jgi:hypothetical protein